MNKQETIANIIAEIRKSDCDEICPWWADGGSCDFCPLGGSGKNCSFSKFADRLEAAHKREKSAIEAEALAVGGMVEASRKRELSKNRETDNSGAAVYTNDNSGDCAKMREALKTVKRYLDGYTVNVLEMRSQVDAALAKPVRNCDVGTAEEQTKRLRSNCEKYKPTCERCKFLTDIRHENCWLKWAQAPYEEGETK